MRVAQPAVRHRDELTVNLREVVLGNEARAGVDLADVVHKHGDADALVVGRDVIEQRRLVKPRHPANRMIFICFWAEADESAM